MTDSATIHQASKKDLPAIAAFLAEVRFIHRHLDWRPTLDWIGIESFLFLEDEGHMEAVLVIPEDPPNIAWVHCFAVRNPALIVSAWNALFREAKGRIMSRVSGIFAVGIEEWFIELLMNAKFSVRQNIVVLEWDHHIPAFDIPNDGLLVRAMTEADLEEVALVDAGSFEKQWVQSHEALRLAFGQSRHTSVAEVKGKIVGYEMTTASQYTAHLARLAVLPGFRHAKIARRLVVEMMRSTSAQGLMRLTVNTQSDNIASLRLYESLGFQTTGEEYPVLQFGE